MDCKKGYYYCNTDKKCKPMPKGFNVPGQNKKPTEVGIGKPVGESCTHTKKGKHCPVHGQDQCPMSEERDPKGPVKSYKSPEEIAKKHKVSVEAIKKQLNIGTEVEGEHTTDKHDAMITALQHLDEIPDYYTKLKKMETQKESITIDDAKGRAFLEVINLISAGTIEEENPCWKGYTQVGMKDKNGKKVPNCVPSKGVPKQRKIKEQKSPLVQKIIDEIKESLNSDILEDEICPYCGCDPCECEDVDSYNQEIDEATRMPAQTGNIISTTLSWRGKYYSIKMFFPQSRTPSKKEINDELQKIYPGSRVVSFEIGSLIPGEPIVQVSNTRSKNYLLNNGTIGEEVGIDEAKKSEMPCNKPKAEAHGSGETGKSHVVKACSGGKEKLIRFGQKGVKGSPKKEGESKEYANRRHRFQARHAKNIAKGKMSAAYWADKVKW